MKPQLNSNKQFVYLTVVQYPLEEGDDPVLKQINYQRIKVALDNIVNIEENLPDYIGNTIIDTLLDRELIVMENFNDIDKIHEWHLRNREMQLIIKNSN